MRNAYPRCRRFTKRWPTWTVAYLIFCMALPVSGQLEDEATLRALTERFFAAYKQESLKELVSLWSQKSENLTAAAEAFRQSFALNDRFELKHLTFRKVIARPATATVRVSVEISATEAKTGKPAEELGKLERTLHFVKEGGEWKVWDYLPSEEDLTTAILAAGSDEERKRLLEDEKEMVTLALHRALVLRGQQLSRQGNHSQALMLYNIALGIAEQLPDKTMVSRVLVVIGNLHLAQSDYGLAMQFYQRGLKLSEEIGNKNTAAQALLNMGIIHHSQNDYVQAREFYQRGLKISEGLGNKLNIANGLNNLGLLYIDQGSYVEALESFKKSLELVQSAGNKPAVARVLQNLADVYNRQGNYVQALAAYNKSLRLNRESGDKHGEANVLNSIGTLYEAQGSYAQAFEAYEKSLELDERSGHKIGGAVALNNIGNIYSLQGDFAKALDAFNKSLKIKQELGDISAVSKTLTNIGKSYYLQGDYRQALEYHQKSLKIAQDLGNKDEAGATLARMADIYISQNDYDKAIDFASRAAAIAAEIDSPEIFWHASATTGKAYRALNQPLKARQGFTAAIATIERLRTQVAGGEKETQEFFRDKVSPYYAMVDFMIERNNLPEALAYAERAKGRALLDVLRSGKLNITRAMTREEEDNERRLSASLVSLNTRIYREKLRQQPDQSLLTELDGRLQKARLEYEAFQTNLYAAHPELKVQRGEIEPLSLDQAAGLTADAASALLEFVVMEEKSYLFVLTASQSTRHGRAARARRSSSRLTPTLKVYPLNIERRKLTELVGDFHKRLAERNLEFHDSARRLYDLLVAPARKQLQGKATICVVPDGVLCELPFQALLSDENRYLIEDYTIYYAPSLAVLNEMAKLSRRRGGAASRAAAPGRPPMSTLLAIGNPALSGATVESVELVHRDERLAPMPEAETEVNTLGRLYGTANSKIYVGAAAREEKIKMEMGSYRVLHFATHGILDSHNPMYSHVLLSQAQDNDAEDGLLEAWEIMNLGLSADMVVLSACDTARGQVQAGEGVIGMTWALFVAGCPTTVVSQWKVSSVSTTRLMVDFHKNLLSVGARRRPALSKAEALRSAALKLLSSSQYRHPFYWAAFVLVGDGR